MKSPISILLLIPIFSSCASPSKSELDAEVTRLCAIDGGVRVYETVRLPAEKYNKLLDAFGRLWIPSDESLKLEDEYYYKREHFYYKKGNPELSSSRHKIIRRSDGKILGESIRYARGGGDFPGPWHDSTYICPDPTSQPSLESSIFLKGE